MEENKKMDNALTDEELDMANGGIISNSSNNDSDPISKKTKLVNGINQGSNPGNPSKSGNLVNLVN